MMAVPYHLLKICGSIVFAARGSEIHSFSSALEHISTWKYPGKQGDGSSGPSPDAQESPAPDGPPTKRRKLEDGQEPSAETTNGHDKSKNVTPEPSNASNERPFIQGLYATADGGHVIAITGADKTIWVFEHDGAGNLKQLSQRQVLLLAVGLICGAPQPRETNTHSRAMPKRPCAIALTRDNRTILSADKFGDVYALPLIPSVTSGSPNSAIATLSRSSTPSSASTTPAPLKPQANELTVHTKRNLKALENQKRSLHRKAAQEQQQQQQRPQFEHALLLGHVSMLTAICVGVERLPDRTREYIVTADRDEHIRVSRGLPQAHVIEGFCLAHEEFVSRLCMAPGGREDVLVSGGGDDDLFVWDWVRGRLLCRAPLLARVREVREDASRVAVTRLLGCRWEDKETLVFALCER